MSSEFTFSPLRSIDDFLLSKARFQKPRFSQRIVSNLIYYQTNYFLMIAFNLLLFGYLLLHFLEFVWIQKLMSFFAIFSFIDHFFEENYISNSFQWYLIYIFKQLSHSMLSPQKMLWALLVSGIGGLAVIFSATRLSNISKGKMSASRQQTYLLLAIILTTTYLLIYNFSSVIILMSSLLISLFFILIHASMRTRNLKNKISNTIDKISTKKDAHGSYPGHF